MMIEGFMVFWIDLKLAQTQSQLFNKTNSDDPMGAAMALMKELRADSDLEFVTMVSQNPMSVGKPGVDAVVNGKTPDGHDYTWSKAGRAGRMKKSDFDGSKVFDEK